jgi:hypothetical protein
MTKFTELPPFPQPKHLKIPFAGETVNEGVFSLWKGHNPSWLTPRFLSVTNSETTSEMFAASSIRSIVEGSIIVANVKIYTIKRTAERRSSWLIEKSFYANVIEPEAL